MKKWLLKILVQAFNESNIIAAELSYYISEEVSFKNKLRSITDDIEFRVEKINNLDKSRELLIQKNSNNLSKDSLDKINQIEKEICINRNELEYLNFLRIKYQKRLENNNMSQKEFRENHLK